MSLEKKTQLTDIQVSEDGAIAWGNKVTILEGGVEISSSVERFSRVPNESKDGVPVEVKAIMDAKWTPELINAFKEKVPEQGKEVEEVEITKDPVPSV